jgi:hypothetical protein
VQKKWLLVTTHFSRARFRDTRGRGWALKTCYAIIKTRISYGSETSISLVLDDTGLTHLSSSSPEEARAWIRRIAGRTDYFERNESTSSTYAVTKVGSERFCDAHKRTWGCSGQP